MKNIAVILAGCGRLDGSEVHESVLTLLSIKQLGANYQCFSLDENQDHVSNHLTNQNEPSSHRNMMVESARIARGDIKPVTELNVEDYDGLIIPGGNGTAFNLFNFAIQEESFTIKPIIRDICRQFTSNRKPVGYICIAPVMIPKIYQEKVNMTVGDDKEIAKLIEKLGAIHHNCAVEDICVDEKYKIVTTPAYMLAQNIVEAYT
ncbi:MAG: isoprenoid biosynthesis glyoxalase ElbB, partial [Neisseriaceae bacterium]